MLNPTPYIDHPELREHLVRATADASIWKHERQAFASWFSGYAWQGAYGPFRSPAHDIAQTQIETIRRLDACGDRFLPAFLATSLRLRAVLPADFTDRICRAREQSPLERMLEVMHDVGWSNGFDDSTAARWLLQHAMPITEEGTYNVTSPVFGLLHDEFANAFHRDRRREEARRAASLAAQANGTPPAVAAPAGAAARSRCRL